MFSAPTSATGKAETASFSEWISERGGMQLDGCSAPYNVSTLPMNPSSDLSCGESIEVTFVVEDACGNTVNSKAIFSVTDITKPVVLYIGQGWLFLKC